MGLKGKLRQIIGGKKSNRRVINAMDRETDNSRAKTLRRVQVSESEIDSMVGPSRASGPWRGSFL